MPSQSIRKNARHPARPPAIPKSLTGIEGLDSITGGGLPSGRPTLVCGSAGCGKTLLAMHFLVNGALAGEPGVFMAFEEAAGDLSKNVASLGFDIDELERKKAVIVDHVRVDRDEILETGIYDLEALFIRLGHSIDSIGAKRVVLDTPEVLFGGFSDAAALRSELSRLFRWLREREVTVVITGERGDGMLTRYGIEEYVSDCVIFLDQRVTDEVTTRRLRVVKYRGSSHGMNEYPFLIDEKGLSVLPVTALGLDYPVSTERISTGIPALDEMLGGKGYYRGSSVLVSGTAGTGKSSIAANFANATCQRGEKCLYFALEEPQDQILRNMRSIGLDLSKSSAKGLLRVHATRPTLFGLEMHLVHMHKLVEEFAPQSVIVDPISSLIGAGGRAEVKSMLVRLFDFLKQRKITALLTCLTSPEGLEQTDVGVSSLIDTWLEVRDIEHRGERNRALYVLKSRGMPHSNQVREFVITSKGLDLLQVRAGPDGVLIGSARAAEDATARADGLATQQAIERKERELERGRRSLDTQIEALRNEFAAREADFRSEVAQQRSRVSRLSQDRTDLEQHRGRSRVNGASQKRILRSES